MTAGTHLLRNLLICRYPHELFLHHIDLQDQAKLNRQTTALLNIKLRSITLELLGRRMAALRFTLMSDAVSFDVCDTSSKLRFCPLQGTSVNNQTESFSIASLSQIERVFLELFASMSA